MSGVDGKVLGLLQIVVATAVAGLILLHFFQEKLIFFPRGVSQNQLRQLRLLGNPIEDLTLTMFDGTKVKGWIAKGPTVGPMKLIIYFGGNAEELSSMVEDCGKFGDWSLALLNYRGYGESEGSPGEKKLKRDALEIFDTLSSRPELDKSKIVVMGRSLGTGIATYVASQRQTAAVILVSPYDSMVSVAQNHYPFLPVSYMLKHRFDSAALAPSIKSPALMLTASNDTLIPPEMSKALADRWGGPVTMHNVANTDHNTISFRPEYWEAIKQFLAAQDS